MNKIKCIYIISRDNNKWAVYREGNKRAIKIFKHRDLAFLYSTKFNCKIVVNNKFGTTDFIYEN